jgi:hypothetical protein
MMRRPARSSLGVMIVSCRSPPLSTWQYCSDMRFGSEGRRNAAVVNKKAVFLFNSDRGVEGEDLICAK